MKTVLVLLAACCVALVSSQSCAKTLKVGTTGATGALTGTGASSCWYVNTNNVGPFKVVVAPQDDPDRWVIEARLRFTVSDGTVVSESVVVDKPGNDGKYTVCWLPPSDIAGKSCKDDSGSTTSCQSVIIIKYVGLAVQTARYKIDRRKDSQASAECSACGLASLNLGAAPYCFPVLPATWPVSGTILVDAPNRDVATSDAVSSLLAANNETAALCLSAVQNVSCSIAIPSCQVPENTKFCTDSCDLIASACSSETASAMNTAGQCDCSASSTGLLPPPSKSAARSLLVQCAALLVAVVALF